MLGFIGGVTGMDRIRNEWIKDTAEVEQFGDESQRGEEMS